ncbi:hypothetical protein NDU88_005582 [Pleurodeles waltl]|uniref:Uncharacterized protein n=1 Tax=Pleurodeles waltl TaxID=8319 RepID=A0AAV7NQP3_PLEWA|nr:hypothetical protein NDU88_005582 [Pleurodeles waltl]
MDTFKLSNTCHFLHLCKCSTPLRICEGEWPWRRHPAAAPRANAQLFLLTSGQGEGPGPRHHRGLFSNPRLQRGHSLRLLGPERLHFKLLPTFTSGSHRLSPPGRPSAAVHESGRHRPHPPPCRSLTRPRAVERTTGRSPRDHDTAPFPHRRMRHRLQLRRASPPDLGAPLLVHWITFRCRQGPPSAHLDLQGHVQAARTSLIHWSPSTALQKAETSSSPGTPSHTGAPVGAE